MTKPQRKWDSVGEIRLMAQADGYCMVRRPTCHPFVMSLSEWLKLPNVTPAAKAKYADCIDGSAS